MTESDPQLLKAYHEALQRGEFRLLQCRDCGGFVFPEQQGRSSCLSSDLRWVEPSGKGVVYSRPVMTPGEWQQGAGAIVQIELEEGPLIAARVMDVLAGEIEVGMPVSAHVALLNGQHALVFYNKEQGRDEW